MYAIIKTVTHFKSLIFNNHVVIFSDNANLIFTNRLETRIQRWKIHLKEFDYE